MPATVTRIEVRPLRSRSAANDKARELGWDRLARAWAQSRSSEQVRKKRSAPLSHAAWSRLHALPELDDDHGLMICGVGITAAAVEDRFVKEMSEGARLSECRVHLIDMTGFVVS
jgi:hypothetical protein